MAVAAEEGVSAKRKRKYEDDNCIVSTTEGFHAIPLPMDIISPSFKDDFLNALQHWWEANLSEPLRFKAKHSLPVKDGKVVIDFKDSNTLFQLFSRYRKIVSNHKVVWNAWNGSSPLGAYLPFKGLHQNGLGITTHLRGLADVLEALPRIRDILEETFGYPLICHGIPNIIVKLPHATGGFLSWHHDNFSADELFRCCLYYDTFDEWGKHKGYQTLAHVNGAGIYDGGHTQFMKYLTPRRFGWLLAMICGED